MYLMPIKTILKSPNTRFLALSSLAIWLGTAVIIGLMYMLIIQKIWSDLERDLMAASIEFSKLYENQPSLPIAELVNKMVLRPELYVIHPASSAHSYLTTIRSQDKKMSSQLELARPPQHIQDHLHIIEEENGAKLITANTQLPDGTVVQFSKRIDYIGRLEIQLIRVLLTGVFATLITAMIISLILARLSLARIIGYNETFENIIAGNMDKRLTVSRINDEYDRLANTINTMLDRIGQLVKSTRQVSDNIAHELRIPLARVRARLDELNRGKNIPEISDSLADLDRVLSMSDQLLRLAQVESATLDKVRLIKLDELASVIVEFYQPVATEKLISLDYNVTGLSIMGDPDLLFQALSNLLDNAIKYTPIEGSVTISARKVHRHCEIDVADTGPGVPEKDLELLFERFHRVDSARSAPGFGLGLSLVKAIVTLHNGRVYALSGTEVLSGLTVRMEFPYCQSNII